ncbi:histidine kinase dimerization/phospho-acceptor domain-containing protein [Anaerocolumna sp.]|uniref:histidine kinase dimerization/phospho-acceptor domain-containing protein n=1 Tax=Anaerocolumna sp. TaxID=2041569 RepID=UPI0028A75A1F|nr:histidine kinase dimerization/phospho-acceptor domain-containing protein [Anaerocolumna sp.]
MRKELLILKNAALQIKEKNLGFEIHSTKVSDFNEILMSLDALKKELAASLTCCWKLEEERKSQFNALVHDIKTPLTIISGNAELLSESHLLKEDAKLNQNILEEVDQIQFYIQTLIEMNQSEKAVSIVKRKNKSKRFFTEHSK